MKHLFATLSLLLFCILLNAQAPAKFSYQAVIRDNSGVLILNSPISIRISLKQGLSNGTIVYQETQNISTNAQGLISMKIGDGTVISGSITGINWGNGPYVIQSEVDPNAGSNYSITGETQLLSVPYALYAENSGTPGPQGPQGPQGAVGPQGPAGTFPNGTIAGQLMYWNGSNWVNLDPGTDGSTLSLCNGVPTWGPCPGSVAAILTTAASNVTANSATVGGNITGNGGSAVTQRGVCYGTSTLPTTANSVVSAGSGNGIFSANMTGLTTGTTYYVRAFATNGNGTSYGNEITVTPSQTIAVGENYQGGVIFYVDNTGQHGLIASTQDLGIGSPWGCEGTNINGTDIIVGSGLFNTEAIVVGCSATNTAAYLCYNLDYNGYSDWYLPSRDELSLIYTNLYLQGLGSLNMASYWSSTQATNNTAWFKQFSTGNNSSNFKGTSTYRVRPVRAF
ncbi:MAG: hypothetical protein RLZZ543_502 [Bacteroidota bacterium]|jgi:hypothetical protein